MIVYTKAIATIILYVRDDAWEKFLDAITQNFS